MTDVATPDGQVDVAFAVGSNYQGVIPFRSGQLLDRITQEVFDGKEPMWILDNRLWCWTPQDHKKTSASDLDELDYYEPPSNPQQPLPPDFFCGTTI
ncbi:hypothetical protein K435DRAFT_778707 [Dendrothele bispora CBS 962.96]|uniref:Uncharacterized protein n=1 Tax=Dendrothele bispora (strain CBS 962.96) TaxID=1314807 RepID=A0A4S8M1Y7_DENBC|nr:hypothetical protein K435DRAFT_778707 [Dendrothele bispora CBS 962.96]